jgi:hypothetical protein
MSGSASGTCLRIELVDFGSSKLKKLMIGYGHVARRKWATDEKMRPLRTDSRRLFLE